MKPNLSLDFCGIKLKNPIMTASGTCGHGLELSEFSLLKSWVQYPLKV